MALTSFYRIMRLGFINFWRNRWLSLAATLMMTLTLLIISFFAILGFGIQATTQRILSRLDMEVYFYDDNVKEEKILALGQDLKKRSDVLEVHYVSKEEAKDNWFKYEYNNEVLTQITEEYNPLPRSLQVKVSDPSRIDTITGFIRGNDYKEIVCKEKKCISSNYEKNQELTQRLISMTGFVNKAGLVIGLIFALVSMLIVLNTIRLTIFTRRDEIEIMKLVGASHSFIRYPFILESLLYGIIATILSLAILTPGIRATEPLIRRNLFINLDMYHYFQVNLPKIILLQLAVGLFIAITCSLISIRKYLKT